MNGHGGNISLINGLASTIGTKHDDVEVLGLTYFPLASEFIGQIRDSDVGSMGHGGEFETSLMLYLWEELVRTSELESTEMDEPYERGLDDIFEDGLLAVYRGFEEYLATGAIGNPELGSAEKERRIYERLGTNWRPCCARCTSRTGPRLLPGSGCTPGQDIDIRDDEAPRRPTAALSRSHPLHGTRFCSRSHSRTSANNRWRATRRSTTSWEFRR